MAALVNKANKEMGMTGAGLEIKKADDITDPEVRNKWGMSCAPWQK